jgi:uncharacterized protein
LDVYALVLTICNKLKKEGIIVDRKLIKDGALLHDIGVYLIDEKEKKKEYWKHGKKGYLICKKEKLNDLIGRICLTHVGVGIGKNIPITLEEEIVAYADKFFSKFPPRKKTLKIIRKKVDKYKKNDLIIFNRWHKKFNIG